MRFPALVSVVLLASCASTSSAVQGGSPEAYRSNRIDVHLGARSLDHGDWSPVEDQGTIGVDFVHEEHDAAVGFEFAFFASQDTKDNVATPGGTVDVTGETEELSAGIRHSFMKDGRIHPYVGGGLSAIRAKFKGESGGASASDDDTSGGIYLHGGVDFDLGPGFVIGADLRVLGGSSVTLFGTDGTADYGQFTVGIGWRF